MTIPQTRFWRILGGTIYQSEVKEKNEAQQQYEKAKEKGQTAGQVKQKSPKASEFGISVNVAANMTVIFNLTYEQLLNRKDGIIEQKISSTPGQVIQDYKVDIYLTESQSITILEGGWQERGQQNIDLFSEDITIERRSQYRAHVKFMPSPDLQIVTGGMDTGFNGDVILRYDVNHDLSAGELQVMNGYFVHYFSPEGLPPARKSVAFVIDVSGSMAGAGKLDYTKDALRTILNDMREGDRFNIITFESGTRTWENSMLDVNPRNIQQAINYVNNLQASGGTDLYGGLTAAIQNLRTQSDDNTATSFSDTYPMMIMLTDGQPTSGITDLSEIRRLTKDKIRQEMSLFTLGFGNFVDSDFLEQLALENLGVYRQIHVGASASLQLKGFYDEVATPLLYNIDISYTDNAIDTDSVTQTNFISYFQGTELVVAGKLSNEIDVEVLSASVSASSRMDNELEMTVSTNTLEPPRVLLNRHAVNDFAQRLWAYKTIKLLLERLKIAITEEEKAFIKNRALELSLKYHFVTPLTSLIVVTPEDQEDADKETEGITAAPTVPVTIAVTPALVQASRIPLADVGGRWNSYNYNSIAGFYDLGNYAYDLGSGQAPISSSPVQTTIKPTTYKMESTPAVSSSPVQPTIKPTTYNMDSTPSAPIVPSSAMQTTINSTTYKSESTPAASIVSSSPVQTTINSTTHKSESTPTDDITIASGNLPLLQATINPSAGVSPGRANGKEGGEGGSGRGGGGRASGFADSDPHFVIHIPANDLSICFDINGNHGDVFDLLTDEELGISVHGSIVSTGKPAPGRKHIRTYFGSIVINLNEHVIFLSPSNITIDNAFTLSWKKITSISVEDFKVSVQLKRRVEVYNDEGINLVFVLHKVKDNHDFKVDHLGFYVDQGDGFSTRVHGLIGQFQYKSIPVVPRSIQINKHLTVTAHLRVDERQVKVLKRVRQNSMTKTHQPCWFARDNGQGLLEGHYSDYLVSNI